MMRLSQVSPGCWAVTFGDSLVSLYDRHNTLIGILFPSRAEAVAALSYCGLKVSRRGVVS